MGSFGIEHFLVVLLLFVLVVLILLPSKRKKPSKTEEELKASVAQYMSLSPEERAAQDALSQAESRYGELMPKVVCPHCQTSGHVHRKAGVSLTRNRVNSLPAKAIGLGTNSEKAVTKLHCTNCSMDWET